MDLHTRYPGIADLRRRARRRIPRFAWEYLESATGEELASAANHAALASVRLRPAVLEGLPEPDLSTRLMGRTQSMPVGIAPVGMAGVIWPGAEAILARAGAKAGVPTCLSTVASIPPKSRRS